LLARISTEETTIQASVHSVPFNQGGMGFAIPVSDMAASGDVDPQLNTLLATRGRCLTMA
jgi:hypothetical protein